MCPVKLLIYMACVQGRQKRIAKCSNMHGACVNKPATVS